MRTTTFLVLLVVMMCITFEVNGFVSFREQQTNEAVVALQVSKRDDEDIPEAEKLSDTKEYMLSKRMIALLDYPSDCNSRTLRRFAETCGLTVTAGGKHLKVYDGAALLTTIPHTVKSNYTCKSIIDTLNAHCA